MSSFSRGLLGLAQHGFLSGTLRSTYCCGSDAASLLRPRHLVRLSSPASAGAFPRRAFSSSTPLYAKQKPRQKPRVVTPPKTVPKGASPLPKAQPAKVQGTVVTKTATSPASATTTGAATTKATTHAAPKPTAHASVSSPSHSFARSGSSYADQLGLKSTPTVLYEAASQFWFRSTGIIAGVLCFGYALTQYWSIYLHPPPDIAYWVPTAFLVICSIMAGIGGYFFMGGAGIVRSIRAIPASKLTAVAGPKAAAKATKAIAERATPGSRAEPLPIFLEVEVSRMVPFLRAKKLYVAPTAVLAPHRFAQYGLVDSREEKGTTLAHGDGPLTPDVLAAMPPQERIKARRWEEERRKKARQYEMDHLMTAPFRHAGQALAYAWQGIRRAFSRDGFVRVSVGGRRYRLDVQGGYALENGRSLDRLVTVQEGKL